MAGFCLCAWVSSAEAAHTSFADVLDSHWAHAVVHELAESGALSGSPEGLFHPDRPATRAEMFKLVLMARGITADTACMGIFADAPCADWVGPVAEMAYRVGLTEGKGSGQFFPHDHVSREELFTVVNRALGRHLEADRLNWSIREERMEWFLDGDEISSWARSPIAIMVHEGHVRGFGDGTFRPRSLATRAEVAALVHRVLLNQDWQTATVDGIEVRYATEMEMVASSYATGEPGVGTVTFSGMTVRIGTVATDPTVIPLGTLLYVEGYGYAVAADTGGAIKGNRIDLFTRDYEAALAFGLQKRKIYLLP